MPDYTQCPECHEVMDITAAAPYNRVVCPACGVQMRVKCDFGNYTLEKRHAVGGMSVVFLAKDEALDREVALKVLNDDYSGDEFRAGQFEKEAELTALISHPNVVRVYSVGRAHGRFFIAMEMVSGKSLESRVSPPSLLSEEELLKIAIQVVEGLQAAKSAGLLHRDIKPGNILVDGNGTAKIVDFGLSLGDPRGEGAGQGSICHALLCAA